MVFVKKFQGKSKGDFKQIPEAVTVITPLPAEVNPFRLGRITKLCKIGVVDLPLCLRVDDAQTRRDIGIEAL